MGFSVYAQFASVAADDDNDETVQLAKNSSWQFHDQIVNSEEEGRGG